MAINDIIKKFAPISLQDMDAVQLQNRVDTKYVLHISALEAFLNTMAETYYILEIDSHRAFTYDTTYFDTPSYQFYRDHHNGCINRIKVRCRTYRESRLTVYEIKRKIYGTRTDKIRFPIEQSIDSISDDLYKLIDYRRLSQQPLEKKLSNKFHRITLASKDFSERITIDYDIALSNDQKDICLDNIAIIEIKQHRYAMNSIAIHTLKKLKIYPQNISKYAIAVSLLDDTVKHNNFKSTLRTLHKIQQFRCPA